MREREDQGQLVNMCMEIGPKRASQLGETSVPRHASISSDPCRTESAAGWTANPSEVAPTWRIKKGFCFESLAFSVSGWPQVENGVGMSHVIHFRWPPAQVARDYGMDSDLISRAEELSRRRKAKEQPLIAASSEPELRSAPEDGDADSGIENDRVASSIEGVRISEGAGASPGDGDEEGGKVIEDAAEVLKHVIAKMWADDEAGRDRSSSLPSIHVLRPGQRHGASHLQSSAVYIVRCDIMDQGQMGWREEAFLRALSLSLPSNKL